MAGGGSRGTALEKVGERAEHTSREWCLPPPKQDTFENGGSAQPHVVSDIMIRVVTDCQGKSRFACQESMTAVKIFNGWLDGTSDPPIWMHDNLLRRLELWRAAPRRLVNLVRG